MPSIQVEGVAVGLKALLRLPHGTDERALVAALAERSIAVAPLAAFYAVPSTPPAPPAIVVNYARPFGHRYAAAVDQLTETLADLLPRASAPCADRAL